MTTKQRLSGPTILRATDAEATVVDAEARRFRLSFASEIPCLRSSWFDEPWVEVLGCTPEEVDTTRLDTGGAPLLWGHDSYERESNIGVIEKAWFENGRGYADVRLSARDDVASIMQDVTDGILKNVSVGYQIQERTLVKQNEGSPNEYRVTRWLPLEISLVSVPADETVGVGRSKSDADLTRYVVSDIPSMERSMSDKTNQPADPASNQQRQADPVVAVTPEAAAAEARRAADAAVVAERSRAGEIETICRAHDMPAEFIRAAVANGDTVEKVRAGILENLADRSKASPHNTRVSVGAEESDKQRTAAEHWLLYRGNEKIDGKTIDLNGNPFRGTKLLDVARSCLERAGVNVRGMDPMEMVRSAISHSTSDFPILLQNVMHKTLLGAYDSAGDVWRTFCAVGNLSDFRPHYRYRMGSFGNLATVDENGEFTQGTIGDAERESITGATKGKLLNISRQMVINDDLGGFLGLSRAMGRGAARSIEDDVFALLAANPTTGDTGALFNATAQTTAGGHANLNAGGAAPTVAGFDAVRVAMAKLKDVGGNDYIAIRPAIWLGPVELGGAARVVNEAQYDVDVSNKYQVPNKSRGLFTSIVDTPRLTGNIWYAFADPNVEPVVEVGFLNGQQAPYMEMKQGFEVDGVTWKVRLDCGVAAVGYRGAQKVTY